VRTRDVAEKQRRLIDFSAISFGMETVLTYSWIARF